ncbi:MAG: protein kinase domain-containing protein [Gemmataceae bacterium]
MSQSESQSEIVVELAEQFLERYRLGERPSLKEYIDRHPELAADIRDVFPAMAMMENIALADESIADQAETERIEAPAAPLQQLGDYRIIREVGHGGMGIVYEAEQVSLGRHVALKLLPQKLLLGAKQKQRFEREAKAAAKLHHTNIVPVFGVGEQDGMPYYVMQFIQGLGLDEVLSELKRMRVVGAPTPSMPAEGELRISRREVSAANMARSLMVGDFTESESGPPGKGITDSPAKPSGSDGHEATVAQTADGADSGASDTATGRLSDTSSVSASSVILPGQSAAGRRSVKKQNYWQSVATIGVQMADALDYAHKQGVLHRDIKPSNLLLDTRGTVWVTDFGLAKTDDHQNLTHTGDILGTLRYMAPESFDGKSDRRSDVYSLGLTLYELLALRPAFDEKDRHRLIKKVTSEEPPRLNRLNGTIPRDLVTIVHKAIDKDPARRYPSADELGADLQRFIDDEPIKARRLTVRERTWRWCRHNPQVAGLTAALVLLLTSATVGSLLAAGHYDQLAKREAETAQDERSARMEATANLEEAQRQKQRAEANFAKARAAVDDYLTKVSESQLIKVPGLQPLRRELLESALGFYQGFLKEHAEDAAIQAELAATYLRIARIQDELSKPAEARKAFDSAIASYETALGAQPHNGELEFSLADCWQSMGMMNFNNHLDARTARIAFQKAIEIQEILLQGDPASEVYKRELARSYNGLAIMQEDRSAAIRSQQRCLELRQELVLKHPDSPVLQHAMGECLGNLGVIISKTGHTPEALAMYERTLAYARAAYQRMPHVIEYGRDLHVDYQNLAAANEALLRPEKALDFAQQDVDHLTRFSEANPAVPELQSDLLNALLSLCFKQARANAERTWKTGQRIAGLISALPQDSADNLVKRADLRMRTRWYVSWCIEKLTADEKKELQRLPADAITDLRKAISLGFNSANRLKSLMINGLGNANLSSPEMAKQYAEIITEIESKPIVKISPVEQHAVHPDTAQGTSTINKAATVNDVLIPRRNEIQADLALAHYAIAVAQIEQEQLTHAERSLNEAQPIFEELDKDDTGHLRFRPYLGSIYVARGMLNWRAGKFQLGKEHFDKGLELLETTKRQDPDSKLVHSLLAEAHWKIGAMWGLTGCWQECAVFWQRSFDDSPYDDWKAYELGSILALTGDTARYRLHCAKILDHAKKSQSPQVTEQAAKICCLLPPPSDQLTLASAAADRAVETGKGVKWEPYYIVAKAIAEYRKDNFKLAVQLLEEIPSKFPIWKDNAWTLHIPRKAVLAMALYRLGRKDEARSMLSNAMGQNSSLRTNFSVMPRNAWKLVDGLISRVLLHEAYLLIEGEPMNETITVCLRAHVYQCLGEHAKAAKELETLPKLKEDDDARLTAIGSALARIGLTDAAQTYLDKALHIKPASPYALRARGELFVYQRQWAKAAVDIAAFVDKVKEDDSAFRLAPLMIQAGDREGYERYCQTLCKRFEQTKEPTQAERTAKACLFIPPPKAYREAALDFADKAIALDRRDWLTVYLHFVKGLAEYRRGNFREAIQWCRRSLEAEDEGMIWFLRVQDELVIAMALAHLHEAGQAKSALARAEQAMPTAFSEFDRAFTYGAWHDWLICQFLHAEAKEAISTQLQGEKQGEN